MRRKDGMDGWKAASVGVLVIAAGLGAGAAYAADVAVAGLFAGRAVLVVDGGAPQTVKVGARTREGIVLRAATSEAATLEHDGTGARINGVAVNALVDTGATLVAMGRSDALRLGIDYRAGTMGQSATANGLATIWKVRLDAVELGGVRMLGVDAAVHETDLPVVLLGMSFLNRMDWRREGDRLLLKKRY